MAKMRSGVLQTVFFCVVAPAACNLLGEVFSAGEFGAWRLEFEDGTHLAAADWVTNAAPAWTCAETKAEGIVRREWKSPGVDVVVTSTRVAEGVDDLRLSLMNRGRTISNCEFPARLRFAPDSVKRFVYPGRGNFGVGMAFNSKFFKSTGNSKRPFLAYRVQYPTLFADFAFLETTDGRNASVYGLQPRPPHEPWTNTTLFNPGATGVGADKKGGWYDHSFALWAKAGGSWTSPAVRIREGATLEAALADYAAANRLTRTLEEKVKNPETLRRLKAAPLFLASGSATELRNTLTLCPVPTLLHLTTYLKGGFDKEYPDHLPPNPKFGTMADFRDLVDFAHLRGHLVCPYTNPTWWCDHPRGPTFLKWGDGALALQRDGKPRHETYAACDGWVQTYFHPGSHEGNRNTIRQFATDIPVDMVFEDQCGARDWIWDFNPVSPSPTAHSEGMISMVEEHSRSLPLATEDGWDQVANAEAALMGCTWRIVPLTQNDTHLKLFKDEFPADTWEIEPVSLLLFHDKCLFYMHNLGGFVMSDLEIPWLLGLGFQFSYRQHALFFMNDSDARDWFDYLHLLQSKVVSRIAGQPLVAFRHDRAPLFVAGGNPARESDDGTITAQYGDVKVLANLGDIPRVVGGKRLAPYGYYVEAPGLEAAKLEGHDPFVRENGRQWVYAKCENAAGTVMMPTVAPAMRGGEKPSIGVIDLSGVSQALSSVTPADWIGTLAASRLGVHDGLRTIRLDSAEAVSRALVSGPDKCFAVVNPYGEIFPEVGEGRWKETLEAIRAYVRAGGVWVETGGASFNTALWHDAAGKWREERLHGAGSVFLDLMLRPFGTLPGTPEKLEISEAGERWLPADVRTLVVSRPSVLNRGVGASSANPVLPLVVNAKGQVWFGGCRFGGIGTLWRIGGSKPDTSLTKAVVTSVLLRQWQNAPEPPPRVFERRIREIGASNR